MQENMHPLTKSFHLVKTMRIILMQNYSRKSNYSTTKSKTNQPIWHLGTTGKKCKVHNNQQNYRPELVQINSMLVSSKKKKKTTTTTTCYSDPLSRP